MILLEFIRSETVDH